MIAFRNGYTTLQESGSLQKAQVWKSNAPDQRQMLRLKKNKRSGVRFEVIQPTWRRLERNKPEIQRQESQDQISWLSMKRDPIAYLISHEPERQGWKTENGRTACRKCSVLETKPFEPHRAVHRWSSTDVAFLTAFLEKRWSGYAQCLRLLSNIFVHLGGMNQMVWMWSKEEDFNIKFRLIHSRKAPLYSCDPREFDAMPKVKSVRLLMNKKKNRFEVKMKRGRRADQEERWTWTNGSNYHWVPEICEKKKKEFDVKGGRIRKGEQEGRRV